MISVFYIRPLPKTRTAGHFFKGNSFLFSGIL